MMHLTDRLEALASCWSEGGPDIRARPGKPYKGGGNTTATTTQINYDPAESARRAQVMDEANRIYNEQAGRMSTAAYPGARPAGVDWNTTAGQDLTRQGAGAIANQLNQTQNVSQGAQQSVANAQGLAGAQNQMMAQGMQYGLNGAMDVRNNPYLQQAMQAAIRPIQEQWQGAGGTLAQQRQAAQQSGQVGSSRAGIAEGITNRAALQKMGDITSQMGAAAYDKGQDTYAKTLAQIAPWMNAGTQNAQLANDLLKTQGGVLKEFTSAAQAPGAMYSGIGAQNENIAREWEDYAANSRMWGLNAPWIPLQNYASLVYGGSAPSTSVQSSQSGQRNALGQVVGAGLTGASLYGMMA